MGQLIWLPPATAVMTAAYVALLSTMIQQLFPVAAPHAAVGLWAGVLAIVGGFLSLAAQLSEKQMPLFSYAGWLAVPIVLLVFELQSGGMAVVTRELWGR